MKTIVDLLMSNDYPNAWIQGHHTRIVMNDVGEYTVYQRTNKDSISSQYTIKLYNGHDEYEAVEKFINSENE